MGKQEQQQRNHVFYSRLFESSDEVPGAQLTVLKQKKKGRIAFLTWFLPTCVLSLGSDFGVGLRSREAGFWNAVLLLTSIPM